MTYEEQRFKWYEGLDAAQYTLLTGVNLNKNPKLFAAALDTISGNIDTLTTKVTQAANKLNNLSSSLTDDNGNKVASARAVKLLNDKIISLQSNQFNLSNNPDENNEGKAASTKATKILADRITTLNNKVTNLGSSSGPSVTLSDNPDQNSSTVGASTKATKKLSTKISTLESRLVTSDNPKDSNETKLATVKATKAVFTELDNKLTQLSTKVTTLEGKNQLTPTNLIPRWVIPNVARSPVSYVGKDGTKFLGTPREWLEVTTSQGKGLIPVYETGTMIDQRA